MDLLHRLLAYGAVVGVVIGIAWSAILVTTRHAGGPAFERLQATVVAVLIVGAASGLMMLAAGSRPADGLHLFYAAIAIALVPLARSFSRANVRSSALLLLVAFVLIGAVTYRLFTIG